MMKNMIFFFQCSCVSVFEIVISIAVPSVIQIKCWDNFYVGKHLKRRNSIQKLNLGKTNERLLQERFLQTMGYIDFHTS